MRLFFDARYIRTDFHDGISRFSYELAQAVYKIKPDTVFIVSNGGQRRMLPAAARTVSLHPTTSWREPFASLLLNRYRPDVVFSPLQTMGSRGRRFKLILTLHDTIYYRYRTPPKDFSRVIRLLWRLFYLTPHPQRFVLNHADMVATVSETSRTEIRRLRLTKRPLVVIANAPRDLRKLTREINLDKNPRQLVYMGSFMPYKNVETLIMSMAYLPDHTLHLLSRIKPKRERELLKLKPTDAKIVFHHGVSDQEYAGLLAQGSILVNASKAEGYGLPVAEALYLGVPAVISDLPIFHEVAGAGALYFNPSDPQDLATKIKSLDNADLRLRLSAKGKKHIEQFAWEKSAATLIEAAEDLSKSKD